MRSIPLIERRATASTQRGSLARRLFLVLATMLLALLVVAGVRLVTFRTTLNALEEFRADTVGESRRIAEVRGLLEKADDAGEAYVESGHLAEKERFVSISSQVDRGFEGLERSGSRRERLLVSSARLRWEHAGATLESAIRLQADGDGTRLDPFHDGLDAAGALLSDAFALNVNEVGQEISSLRDRERAQLYTSLVIIILGFIVGGLGACIARSRCRSGPWKKRRRTSAARICPTGSTCAATMSSHG